jgi:hypothetical protein
MATPRSSARQDSSITSAAVIGTCGVIALVGIIPVGQKLTISSLYGVKGCGKDRALPLGHLCPLRAPAGM